MVDQQPKPEAVGAVQRLDHRQADERGVAKPAHQRERANLGPRQAHQAATCPEQQRAYEEQQPRHQHWHQVLTVELECVQRAQRHRRECKMDDRGVQHLVGTLADAIATAQQHAGNEADHDHQDVGHSWL